MVVTSVLAFHSAGLLDEGTSGTGFLGIGYLLPDVSREMGYLEADFPRKIGNSGKLGGNLGRD